MSTKVLKVHLVHFSTAPGGLEVLIPRMINNLDIVSFSAFVIRPKSHTIPGIYENSGITIRYGSRNNIRAFSRLFIYGFRNRKEIFHVFNIGPAALFILRLSGVKKLIYSIHGTIYWKNLAQKFLRKLLWRAALSRSFLIASNSNYSAAIFAGKIITGREIKVLYNPIDFTRFKPDSNKIRRDVPQKIVYCGRLAKGKNLVKWVEAADYLIRYFKDTVFEIYGEGPMFSELESLIARKCLQGKVFLRGFIKHPEKIYQSADLLLFLSEYESFGNVVVESILCGTPVIASSIPSMKEIFSEFQDFLVDLDNNLENSIMNKINNLKHLNSITSPARDLFIEKFSAEKHYRKLLELYFSFGKAN